MRLEEKISVIKGRALSVAQWWACHVLTEPSEQDLSGEVLPCYLMYCR